MDSDKATGPFVIFSRYRDKSEKVNFLGQNWIVDKLRPKDLLSLTKCVYRHIYHVVDFVYEVIFMAYERLLESLGGCHVPENRKSKTFARTLIENRLLVCYYHSED